MVNLWDNIRANLAKMQVLLMVVEQGLLQIKAAEQRERQLALAAWHQTLAARGLLVRRRLQRVPPAIHTHLVCYIYKWEKGIYNTNAYHILLVISWALFMTH
jgi:hypothetical protein